MKKSEKKPYPVTKVEIFSKEKEEEEKFHVKQKDSFFDTFRETGRFKTYDEAHEFATRLEKVTYLGLFEDGNRRGMMDFSNYTPKIDAKEFRRKSLEAYKDYDKEKSKEEAPEIEHEKKYLRKEKRR